jgi:hypothetical protein
MRPLPRSWDAETLVCAVRGHVLPAAAAARLVPEDASLGVDGTDGTRLSRCLRCDTWVRSARPTGDEVHDDRLPPVAELPRPRRGRSLTVVATAGFLPIELRELSERVTVTRVVLLGVNVAVLVYLVWAKRLFGLRGGREAAAVTTDWGAVLGAAPPSAGEVTRSR